MSASPNSKLERGHLCIDGSNHLVCPDDGMPCWGQIAAVRFKILLSDLCFQFDPTVGFLSCRDLILHHLLLADDEWACGIEEGRCCKSRWSQPIATWYALSSY